MNYVCKQDKFESVISLTSSHMLLSIYEYNQDKMDDHMLLEFQTDFPSLELSISKQSSLHHPQFLILFLGVRIYRHLHSGNFLPYSTYKELTPINFYTRNLKFHHHLNQNPSIQKLLHSELAILLEILHYLKTPHHHTHFIHYLLLHNHESFSTPLPPIQKLADVTLDFIISFMLISCLKNFHQSEIKSMSTAKNYPLIN